MLGKGCRATANQKFRDPGHPKPKALNIKDARVVGVGAVLCPWYGPFSLFGLGGNQNYQSDSLF